MIDSGVIRIRNNFMLWGLSLILPEILKKYSTHPSRVRDGEIQDDYGENPEIENLIQ